MIDAYRTAQPADTPIASPPTTLQIARASPTTTALLTVASVGLGVLLSWGRGAPPPTIVTLPMAAAPPAIVMPPLPAQSAQSVAPTRPIVTSVPPVWSSRAPSPPAILMTSGVSTHDPAQLLARARRLASSGVDVRVLEVDVPSIVVERAKARGNDLGATSIVPFEERGKTIGLRLGAVRPNSPLAHAGLESNDIVVAVNGHAVEDTSWYDAAARKTGTKSLFVVEVIRSGERVVLAVHWTA